MAYNTFDLNGVGHKNGKLFELPFTPEEATVVIVPVPWSVTVSSNAGGDTALAPKAILDASYQIDLFDQDIPDAWKMGISMLPISDEWQKRNAALRRKAQKVLNHLEQDGAVHDAILCNPLEEVNEGCADLVPWVKKTAAKWLEASKIVGVLGGDHSTSLGLMEALGERFSYGVLHIDAHLDLRNSYGGFRYSHASIMKNAANIKTIQRFVHVAIRDYCDEEYKVVEDSKGRHVVFTDRDMQRRLFKGEQWQAICREIVQALPQNVYVSFDIDGLDPSLCPSTGTPVPGGLMIEEAMYLILQVAESGKKIIGFDLCEVAPGPNTIDANVGMRILYRLAGIAGKSCGKIEEV